MTDISETSTLKTEKNWFKYPKKIQKNETQYPTKTLILVMGAYWVEF